MSELNSVIIKVLREQCKIGSIKITEKEVYFIFYAALVSGGIEITIPITKETDIEQVIAERCRQELIKEQNNLASKLKILRVNTEVVENALKKTDSLSKFSIWMEKRTQNDNTGPGQV